LDRKEVESGKGPEDSARGEKMRKTTYRYRTLEGYQSGGKVYGAREERHVIVQEIPPAYHWDFEETARKFLYR